jgi:AcrR family transcriptional regulator
MAPSRQTADERRAAVLEAAISDFARSGFAGTSTEDIAARAGISQPYLFQLFGTKKELFVATFELVSSRIVAEMTRASEGLEGGAAASAMGEAYVELMQDPDLLQVQLHGFAAAPADPDIAGVCRRTFEALAEIFSARTHLGDDALREFFAMGMLINVMSAIDLGSDPERWAQNLCGPPPQKWAPTQRSRRPSSRNSAAKHP